MSSSYAASFYSAYKHKNYLQLRSLLMENQQDWKKEISLSLQKYYKRHHLSRLKYESYQIRNLLNEFRSRVDHTNSTSNLQYFMVCAFYSKDYVSLRFAISLGANLFFRVSSSAVTHTLWYHDKQLFKAMYLHEKFRKTVNQSFMVYMIEFNYPAQFGYAIQDHPSFSEKYQDWLRLAVMYKRSRIVLLILEKARANCKEKDVLMEPSVRAISSKFTRNVWLQEKLMLSKLVKMFI